MLAACEAWSQGPSAEGQAGRRRRPPLLQLQFPRRARPPPGLARLGDLVRARPPHRAPAGVGKAGWTLVLRWVRDDLALAAGGLRSAAPKGPGSKNFKEGTPDLFQVGPSSLRPQRRGWASALLEGRDTQGCAGLRSVPGSVWPPGGGACLCVVGAQAWAWHGLGMSTRRWTSGWVRQVVKAGPSTPPCSLCPDTVSPGDSGR